MQVFRTESDCPHDVQILGVGVLLSRGQNAIDVERAAKGMTELSEKDENGQLVLDEQGGSVPLTGKALTDAAKAWADRIAGIEVASMTEAAMDKQSEGEMNAEDAQAAAEMYAAQISPIPLTPDQLVAGTLDVAGQEEAEEAKGPAASASTTDGGEE